MNFTCASGPPTSATPPSDEPAPFVIDSGPAALIHELPLDIIAAIVGFAPWLARLRTLSLVCKRWRTACVRSIRHLPFVNLSYNVAATRTRSAAASLFPSLVSLSLSNTNLCVALPSSLTRLRINATDVSAIKLLLDEAPHTALSAHLPHLTTLHIHLSYLSASVTAGLPSSLWSFIDRHLSTLTTLKLNLYTDTNYIIPKLSGAAMPEMRCLLLNSHATTDARLIERILRNAPKLQSFQLLSRIPLDDVCTIPASLLAPLELLHVDTQNFATTEQIHFLDRLPNLHTTNCRPDFNTAPHLQYGTYRINYAFDEPLEKLTRNRRARFLRAQPAGPQPVPLPRLPSYCHVDVTWGAHACAYALAILDATRGVHHMQVSLEEETAQDRLIDCIERLVVAGVRSGLRELIVCVREVRREFASGAASTHPLVAGGWIRLKVHKPF